MRDFILDHLDRRAHISFLLGTLDRMLQVHPNRVWQIRWDTSGMLQTHYDIECPDVFHSHLSHSCARVAEG